MDSVADVSFTGLGMGADIAVIVAGYFVPVIVAGVRGHRQVVAIAALNLLLGWTGLGWVIGLAWSLTATPGKDVDASSSVTTCF